MTEKTKVFITKFVLTRGIIEKECSITSDDSIAIDGDGKRYYTYFFPVDYEWFFTLELAKMNAELRRDAKIASLKKQLEKLEKMRF